MMTTLRSESMDDAWRFRALNGLLLLSLTKELSWHGEMLPMVAQAMQCGRSL